MDAVAFLDEPVCLQEVYNPQTDRQMKHVTTSWEEISTTDVSEGESDWFSSCGSEQKHLNIRDLFAPEYPNGDAFRMEPPLLVK